MISTRWWTPIVGLCLTGCLQGPIAADPPLPSECHGETTPAIVVPTCLVSLRILSSADRDSAVRVFTKAQELRDSLLRDTAIASFAKAAELTRSLTHISQFYAQNNFLDTARFHRMQDQVAVTMEYVKPGSIVSIKGRLYPRTTPYLAWQYYPNTGIYFQPVSTINPQFLTSLVARRTAPLDSLLGMTDALYDYRIQREHRGRSFIVWEYEFPFNSGGVLENPPWISSQAQGLAMMVFLERYRRTGEGLWKDHALEVFESYKVKWDDGGILLPDTAHGYWWEEFSPTVKIWNGSAWSVLGVGFLWQVTSDPEVKRIFDRGIEALKYYTPQYDTGSWTLYSQTQGYNSVAYHKLCITIMDQLHAQTGDMWFKDVADRWRTYVPPSGVK